MQHFECLTPMDGEFSRTFMIVSMHMHFNEHSCSCWKFRLEGELEHLVFTCRHLQKQDKASVLPLVLPPPFSKHFLWANMPRHQSSWNDAVCWMEGALREGGMTRAQCVWMVPLSKKSSKNVRAEQKKWKMKIGFKKYLNSDNWGGWRTA